MGESWEAGNDSYRCVWENGTVTEESYASALMAFSDVTDKGNILLERDGLRGEITASAAFVRAVEVVRYGKLAQLLAMRTDGFTRLENAAMFMFAENRIWIDDGEAFAYSGDRFGTTTRERAQEIVLLSGKLPAEVLAASRATVLTLHASAVLTADMLVGTSVQTVNAQAPYFVVDGAIYLETAGGVRLVAALPTATDLVIGNIAYADAGALLPCTGLRSLSLPFVGNMASDTSVYFRGEFAHLFSAKKGYVIPKTLDRITVRGGIITSHAFFKVSSLLFIDACGIKDFERDAFSNCTALRILHAMRDDLLLSGDFSRTRLTDGCTMYQRIG